MGARLRVRVAWALLFCAATPALAQEDAFPEPLPVEVQVQAGAVQPGGGLHLFASFWPLAPLEDVDELVIGLDFGAGATHYERRELDPRPADWEVGKRTLIELDLVLPVTVPPLVGEDPDHVPGSRDLMLVTMALARRGAEQWRAPLGARIAADDTLEVCEVELPAYFRAPGRADLEAVLDAATKMQQQDDPAGAWDLLVEGLREASRDGDKERLRDSLKKVGRHRPRPMTPLETNTVASRIRSEQVRYWRLEAGRMVDAGQLHGALRILERIGGSLRLDADEAVIGALDKADRMDQDIDDLRRRMTRELSKEEEQELEALVDEHGLTKKLFKEAEKRYGKGEVRLAVALLRELRQADQELEDQARARWPEMEEEYLAATPPAEAERVRAALEHPAWERTKTSLSHQFIFIGPEDLVREIPQASRLHFDLAYVFLTDLFGRLPNPEGDRITVYFKELWDFGGGVGGGKIIDIGNADPHPKKPVRVDTGLLYHELTHCVDDTSPIHAGFREGLANLGAAYAFEALDQDSDALHSFDRNLEEFRKYFLGRDLEYWRIQNYGPSAGFFLHFVDSYARVGKANHDWSGLRRFFREYRDAPVRDGREPFVARGLAHFLVRAFGPAAFDDLIRFGFPLEERDRRVLAHEFDAFDWEDYGDFEGAFEAWPTSPLPRDRAGRRVARVTGDDADERALLARHGVITRWQTIGPFFTRRADAAACPFPPEERIDFEEKVPALRSTKDGETRLIWREPHPTWRSAFGQKPVTIDPTGWVEFDYKPYGQRNAAIYAVTSVTLAEDHEVLFHLRTDDDFALFVDGDRVATYEGRGFNGSSSNARWRGPFVNLPDAQQFAVPLSAGRHTLVVKIKNKARSAGVVMALSELDGSTLDFVQDLDPPAPYPAAPERGWRRVVRLDHRSFKAKTKASVGGFRSARKAVSGTSEEKGVQWRRWTVRPGFPKDSPSNLAWLKPKLTEDLTDFRALFELETDARAPKFLFTFQGEGEQDGLSGWTLILLPHRDSLVNARLERYDRLVYETERLKIENAAGLHELELELVGDRFSARLDELQLFERVPLRLIPDAHRMGIATWGPEPRLVSFELFRGK